MCTCTASCCSCHSFWECFSITFHVNHAYLQDLHEAGEDCTENSWCFFHWILWMSDQCLHSWGWFFQEQESFETATPVMACIYMEFMCDFYTFTICCLTLNVDCLLDWFTFVTYILCPQLVIVLACCLPDCAYVLWCNSFLFCNPYSINWCDACIYIKKQTLVLCSLPFVLNCGSLSIQYPGIMFSLAE